jgi:N-acetyl-anhydromuramoyl-L-alanine amidase
MSVAPGAEIDAGGWLDASVRLPSPNFEPRPGNIEPTLIVVHNMSLPPDEFGGSAITEFFQNRLDHDAHPYYAQLRGMRVSAHFVIRRDGTVEQYVSCNERAWHAGLSSFFGRERCNDFSVGIELEGSDRSPFEAAQYTTLSGVVNALMRRYPIDAIAGHSDVAPGRKTDPGPYFEWPRLQADTGLPAQYFPYLTRA